MTATVETDGTILLMWLRLLGWQTATGRDGDLYVGVASHIADSGAPFRVGGCGGSEAEVALQLFEGAMRALERSDAPALSTAA